MSDREQRTFIADEASGSTRRPGRDPTIVPGDVLNGIYLVERFIARGGMGEVFEGVNIESEERVAIKAIRSHLASDPKVIALFRKEARVLTQFAHPAIVGYRVFARDPVLDLHYIVADFINGEPLGAHLNGVRPHVRDVVALGRRLATGLEVAHDHGAIHRDMSPDNVLLPDGRFDHAKIIDFGIAKSLDLSLETMVGDGFAGKLGYVAPEQFGDYGRQIGPWTDVYSTALVLLAFARGAAPPMGTTLSEAVERRRTRPDLSDLPVELAPLIERMTAPDPAMRMRTMREVLLGLDNIRIPGGPDSGGRRPDEGPTLKPKSSGSAEATTFAPAAGVPEQSPSSDRLPKTTTPLSVARGRPLPRALGLALPIGVVAMVAAGLTWDPSPSRRAIGSTPTSAPPISASSSDTPGDRAARVQALLAALPCSWIDARNTSEDAPVALRGGAADIALLRARVRASAGSLGTANAAEVLKVSPAQCNVINALQPFRAPPVGTGTGSVSPMATVTASAASEGDGAPACAGAGARSVELTAVGSDPAREIALITIQPDGRLLQIASGREEFERLAMRDPAHFNLGSDGSYHAAFCYSQPGVSAVAMLESRRALNLGLQSGIPATPPPDFAQRLGRAGSAADLRVFADWLSIEGNGAPTGGQPPLVQPTVASLSSSPAPKVATVRPAAARPDREPRDAIALDAAAANRRELARIRGRASGGASTCRRYAGGWEDVGAVGRSACIATAIKGRCTTTYAMFEDRLFRRANGHIQEKRGSRWRDVSADSDC
jgi:serine/threonine-protein kinase